MTKSYPNHKDHDPWPLGHVFGGVTRWATLELPNLGKLCARTLEFGKKKCGDHIDCPVFTYLNLVFNCMYMCIYIILIYNYYIYIYEFVNITYIYIQLWYIYIIWYCMITYYIIKCVCVWLSWPRSVSVPAVLRWRSSCCHRCSWGVDVQWWANEVQCQMDLLQHLL